MRNHVAIALLAVGLSSAPRTSRACSNFYFNKNGYSMIAHNMEWITGDGLVVINKRHVQKRGFQVKNDPEFTWTSKYGSISLTFDGRESTGRGINEAGLLLLEAAMADTEQSRDHNLPLLSVAQWTQYQLDTSATIEDVIASDKAVRISPDDMQSHFFIWDRSGRPAVIEWLGGKMVVYRDATLPIPVINNSTYESCVANGDDPSGRFKTIVNKLDSYDPATDSDGLGYVYSIFQDVNTLVRWPVQSEWSVVFDFRASRLYISTAKNSDLRYFSLTDFDFSCQNPVEVLDINGPGSGDVRSKFVPYTTELNRKLVEATYSVYNSYGLFPTSEETLNELINFPDTTTCADGDKPDPRDGADGSVTDGAADGANDTRGAKSADSGSAVSDGGSSGCSCRVGRRARGSAEGLAASLLGLALATRRRRGPKTSLKRPAPEAR
jgi:penicillin V acylase-like amidase (Ntn superfamily)